MAEQELKTLIRKRGAIKAKHTSFQNYFEEFLNKYEQLKQSITAAESENNEVSLSDLNSQVDLLFIQLDSRYEKIQEVFYEFNEIQNAIECSVDEDQFETQTKERENFENQYYSLTSKTKKVLHDYNKNQNIQTIKCESFKSESHASTHSNVSDQDISNLKSIRLPVISLPKFNGDISHWLEFKDSYISLIHENNTISAIQKFHYLRASLESSALQVVSALEFSAANYELAFDLLIKRFDNKRMLIQNHIRSLFNLKQINKESPIALRNLRDSITKHIRALATLGQKVENWDVIIIHLAVTKLDLTTTRQWEELKVGEQTPTLNEFYDFLKTRADLLETLEHKGEIKTYQPKSITKTFVQTNDNNKTFQCTLCKGNHNIYACPDFLKLSPEGRYESAKKINICLNCLRKGHSTRMCKSLGCRTCHSKSHNTLLHMKSKNNREQESNSVFTTSNDTKGNESNIQPKASTSTSSTTLNLFTNNSQTLLSTASVLVIDDNGHAHTVRALLDCGSMSSFITSDLYNRLNLKSTNINLTVSGLNNTVSHVNKMCHITISSKVTDFITELKCFIIPEITNTLPSIKLNQKLKIPNTIKIADPSYHNPSKIDILIGGDKFWELILHEQQSLGKNLPLLKNTHFGWLIVGQISGPQSNNTHCHFNKTIDIQKQLTRFWELEEYPNDKFLSVEEQNCENHFIKTVNRDLEGRFVVSIPFKRNVTELGDSYQLAKKRFLSLERKFKKDEILKIRYHNFIKEYISLGHMSKVVTIDFNSPHFFLPHHGVIKENSVTTKLRVVFDGSATTTSGVSLNDLQMVGPTIQQDLLSILLRFRIHNYIIGADIEKMYRQVNINKEQRVLQQILWRDEPSESLSTYTLNTVTYGTASASYLAIRSLYQLSIDYALILPDIAEIIKNDFYVDNLLTGSKTIEEGINIVNKITEILLNAKFPLRQWISNNSQIISAQINGDDNNPILNLGINENAKTLGLLWNSIADELYFTLDIAKNDKVTKRSILSNLSRIFDPMGLLSACTITSKVILQQLWQFNLSWDENVPHVLKQKWLDYYSNLSHLSNIRIPRQVACKDFVSIQLHIFSDASKNAYGACAYIVSKNPKGELFSRLLCSKAKVSPIKTITIPRLELCGALVAAKLASKIKDSLKVPIENIFYWCDSTIVLGWITTSPNLLQTFCANRISQIQNLTNPNDWKYVPSNLNPADILSRGISPQELVNLKSWWYGPSFLLEDSLEWPKSPIGLSTLPELKGNHISLVSKTTYEFFNFENYSSLNRLIRIMAYSLRFINNSLKSKNNILNGILKTNELKNSLNILIKISQMNTFNTDISRIKNKQNLSNNLAKLNPFIDDKGIMRVGGRLVYSNLSYDKKHPIILSCSHKLSKLIFEYYHILTMHSGPQMLLFTVREKYWILSGRNLARKTVHNCVKCFKAKPRFENPLMGNLPVERIKPAPPFYTTGIDYAGYFHIKDRKGRGCKVSKCYVCVFVCFCTKAVHLEVISDLTTEAFIAALRRFTARRGKPLKIFSDNATNFVGADKELQELNNFLIKNQNTISEFSENEGICWSFIPPASPHQGGLWEAGVKSMKHHLKRISSNALLTFEQFYTLITQIEATLNSRPISPLSSNPEDLLPLTPAHFLIHRPYTSIADPDLNHIPQSRLSQYQQIQKLHQHFWSRWSKEYISELQTRCKWKESSYSLKTSDLVLIKDENLPPSKWLLGRIVMVHPGKDGIARVATIKTSLGTLKRCFSKICKLPID